MKAHRTALITGATDGLGSALAHRLAAEPSARLFLHGRDRTTVASLASVLADAPAQIETVVADLADLRQVHALADEVLSRTGRLDTLVNNAGIGAGEPDGTTRKTSADGHELRFAVNYLAPFVLTERLLELVTGTGRARIVNVASIGQSPVDLDDLGFERGYDGQEAYGRSKLALIAYGFALARRVDPAAATVNSLHPATYMPTKMVLRSVGYSIDTLETGVDNTLHLVASDSLASTTGTFFDGRRPARAHPQAYEPTFSDRLIEKTARLVAG